MSTQEHRKNELLEKLLEAAGWSLQDQVRTDFKGIKGVAVRDFSLARECGTADYLLVLNGKAAGLIEAKALGVTLSGFEAGSEKSRRGLPFSLPLFTRPLPFLYESNGAETQFTNGFDPEPKPRRLFAFHKPETLTEWMEEGLVGGHSRDMATDAFPEYAARGMTFLHRLWINMPPPPEAGPGAKAIAQLEEALRRNHRRTLISMKDRSEHLLTALLMIFRLFKFAGARRVLYLFNDEDRMQQALKAFQSDDSPREGLHSVRDELTAELFESSQIGTTSKVLIGTSRQIIALVQKKEMSVKEAGKPDRTASQADKRAVAIEYNPSMPIETFDLIFIDESHQSAQECLQALADYFDAYLIGFAHDLDDKTRHFFHSNLDSEGRQESNESHRVNVSFEL